MNIHCSETFVVQTEAGKTVKHETLDNLWVHVMPVDEYKCAQLNMGC